MRKAAERPAPAASEKVGSAIAVVWMDNSIPRARVWFYDVEAEKLFRDVLLDRYLLEGATLSGRIDADFEIHSGQPATITGQIRLRNATMMWEEAEFALDGITGYVPYERVIGTREGFAFNSPARTKHIHIDRMVWADRPIATKVSAHAGYKDRILSFTEIELGALGGSGIGTVISDHRGEAWRVAAMLKFTSLKLRELRQILPGLPILARKTEGELDGQVGLVFSSPSRISITGKVVSGKPGSIEISPRLHERIGKSNLESPIIEFQKLKLELTPSEDGQIEANLDLHRRTAQNFREIVRGVPFRPHVVSIRFPLLPFVSELSQGK